MIYFFRRADKFEYSYSKYKGTEMNDVKRVVSNYYISRWMFSDMDEMAELTAHIYYPLEYAYRYPYIMTRVSMGDLSFANDHEKEAVYAIAGYYNVPPVYHTSNFMEYYYKYCSYETFCRILGDVSCCVWWYKWHRILPREADIPKLLWLLRQPRDSIYGGQHNKIVSDIIEKYPSYKNDIIDIFANKRDVTKMLDIDVAMQLFPDGKLLESVLRDANEICKYDVHSLFARDLTLFVRWSHILTNDDKYHVIAMLNDDNEKDNLLETLSLEKLEFLTKQSASIEYITDYIMKNDISIRDAGKIYDRYCTYNSVRRHDMRRLATILLRKFELTVDSVLDIIIPIFHE